MSIAFWFPPSPFYDVEGTLVVKNLDGTFLRLERSRDGS